MTTVPVSMQHRLPLPAAAPRPSQAAAGMSIGDVVRILKQRIFLILFMFLFFTGSTVGLTFWLQKNHPRYSSISAVRVESPFPKNPLKFGEPLFHVEVMNRFVSDQMFMVKDEGLLRETLKNAQIHGTTWYQQEPDKNALLQELKRKLGVRQAPNASIFMVSFSTRNR